jgi:hypothetical protein
MNELVSQWRAFEKADVEHVYDIKRQPMKAFR